MDSSLKIFDLQLRIKLLEELLIEAEKNNGYLYELLQDLNNPSKYIRQNTKSQLLNRGIGVNKFSNDEDPTIKEKANRILQLRKDDCFGNDAYLNEDIYPLDTPQETQVIHIERSMFLAHKGGING